MSSLNPCLRGLRQLLMQATTPATTCLTTEGWAKCATTWHWLMTVTSTLLTAVCTFPPPLLLPSTCQGKYEFTPKGSSWTKVQFTKCQKKPSKVSVFIWWPCSAEALCSTMSNALQQIRGNQMDQKHWMPFEQNQRTYWRWAVFSMQSDNRDDHSTIFVILPKNKTKPR